MTSEEEKYKEYICEQHRRFLEYVFRTSDESRCRYYVDFFNEVFKNCMELSIQMGTEIVPTLERIAESLNKVWSEVWSECEPTQ